MTATQAPTPGPLDSESVKLLVKLLDTLKPFAEVAEKLKHCHVVEICEPTPDNPSRNIIPMPREWFERAGDDLEYIAIQLHASGVLSEGQASKITGLDRVSVRREVDRLAPTAPVEASGSERGQAGAVMDALWPLLGGNHTSAELWTEIDAAVSEALRPQPSGETRDGPEVGEDAVAKILAPYLPTINSTPDLLSILYDADLMPEQTVTVRGAICVAAVCEAYKAALRPAPVASGGQHSSGEWRCEDCGAQADEWFDCCKNPARAEAQDEGAAGEPVAWRYRWKPTPRSQPGDWREPTNVRWKINDRIGYEEEPLYAHPSPPPAADEDRVRIAVEALEPFAAFAQVAEAKSRMALGEVLPDDKILASISWEGGLGVLVMGHFRDALSLAPNPKGWSGLYRRSDALKSTAAKEGGE